MCVEGRGIGGGGRGNGIGYAISHFKITGCGGVTLMSSHPNISMCFAYRGLFSSLSHQTPTIPIWWKILILGPIQFQSPWVKVAYFGANSFPNVSVPPHWSITATDRGDHPFYSASCSTEIISQARHIG